MAKNDFFTTKAKRAAYGKPSRPDQVNAKRSGSQPCREAASVVSAVVAGYCRAGL
ncbi:hypothetical protein [Selenomonas ruminantium]|uniref:hypothetical protein n=1 Tax=Selenomonas ruminantium TaxID=971 RepID=UPI0026EB9D6C|nr:hypothetical protein [Selenomonas ruminantium]